MNYVEVDGYLIEIKGWFGDYEDCVVAFRVTEPNGKVREESRMGSASKKGIFKTSVYGIKLKVDLETETLYLV